MRRREFIAGLGTAASGKAKGSRRSLLALSSLQCQLRQEPSDVIDDARTYIDGASSGLPRVQKKAML
jgi:hypothetical protein